MPKSRTTFFCSDCGHESTRWLGRCPGCESWNTFVEAPVAATSKAASVPRGSPSGSVSVPVRLADVSSGAVTRISSGIGEFDQLLGGGIVPGSLVLLGGPPGAGKSTLVLQIAAHLAEDSGPVVYVCGEESAAQTKLRAERLGAHDELLIFAETNLRAILDALNAISPRVLVIDSIQTMALPEIESSAGSVAQVRECATALMEFAKRTHCATFMVGHVTKDGAIAGPRLLEHIVDTVLYFEGENGAEYRIVRAHKNRFGSADEICVLQMGAEGLKEVENPSKLFLGAGHNGERATGSCVVSSFVGSRPVLVEIQALVGETSFGTPQRLAANVDRARLAMILAVLERRAGMNLGNFDVYASVAGGLRVNEPAADLGIALAIASAFRHRSLPGGTLAFGELGLSGEVRAVSHRARRVGEGRKLGFTTIVEPAGPHAGGDEGTIVAKDIASGHRRYARLIARAAVEARIFECVPNVSEGRDLEIVDACARAIESTGVTLANRTSDAIHHRSVFTFFGSRERVRAAALALATVTTERIDLRTHRGAHPRIGALDVLPFVPFGSATMADAVELAREAAHDIWQTLGVPSVFYAEAATNARRRLLGDVRAGGFEALVARGRHDGPPDTGDVAFHPSAGSIAAGARRPLVAFNIVLATGDLELARAIARTIRERGGGLRTLRAIAVALDNDRVQVSCNLTDHRATPMHRVLGVVRELAARANVRVERTELIGLVPRAALAELAAHAFAIEVPRLPTQ